METFTEIFQEQENLSRPEKLGELVKLGEHTYVMGRNHKDIYKGTITRKGDNYEIRTKQESGKRFQFMVMDNKDGTVTIGARPTNATGRRLELFTVRGDLLKVAKKYSTVKSIEKAITDNIKNIQIKR